MLWAELAELILAQVIMFNKKCQGEVSKMTVKEFIKNCSQGKDDLLFQSLSKWEQQLCGIIWRVEIVGKKGRTVPILLTTEMKSNMNILMQYRKRAGVWETDSCFHFVKAMGTYEELI